MYKVVVREYNLANSSAVRGVIFEKQFESKEKAFNKMINIAKANGYEALQDRLYVDPRNVNICLTMVKI